MAATHESLAMLAAVRALDLDGVASDVEIEETRAALRDAREMLANPLAYPPREEKDRAVVRQGAVEVRGREVRLGALDIENALVLRCVGVARSHRSRLGRRANVPPRTPRRAREETRRETRCAIFCPFPEDGRSRHAPETLSAPLPEKSTRVPLVVRSRTTRDARDRPSRPPVRSSPRSRPARR